MNDVLGSIFRTLDMEKANGLANSDSDNMTVFQRYFFAQVKEKMGLDAVFFLRDTDGAPKIPLIYFSAIDFYDPEKIAELHRLAWNTCEAPLLFIVTPDQLLIYNNYTPPCRCEDGSYDYLTGLIEQISLVNDLEAQRKLLGYHRTKLETGEFWQRNLARFDIKSRVDNTLMSNLKEIRKTLLANIKGRNDGRGLDASSQAEIVHALLGRSILIKYLEERTDSDGKTVFPTDFFPAFLPNAEKYTDILVNKDATYRLFRTLENKFNGDMFPLVDYESDIITQADLTELRLFILGDSDLASSQTVLWPLYSFNVIPIQLISSIYELFFHLAEDDQSNDNGTYYTPLHLVEMLMDEVLPWEGHYYNAKILDPACGSGIFLVEAYRRLICRWKFSKQAEKISAYDLAEILQSCIFGIDINEEAIRVASFSLSLAMCDFLEPRTIWNELQFPRLLHYNLFPNDFFERKRDWEKRHFDIVIGNPPWKSEMSPAADEYIADTRLIIGDKQIAQAFTWRAMDVCPEGVICLLLPSKGFLFNRSPTTTKYRRLFFEKCDVSAIINFSVFRRYLFEHGAGPAAGVIYRVKKTDSHNEILYCTPKPQHTIEDRRRFLIEPNDICRIPFELCNDDLIWKIAMWGSPRDMDLVHSMQSMHKSLRAVLDEQKMDYAEGYKRGNRKRICHDFIELPIIEARTFAPGNINADSLKRVDFSDFECTVIRKRSIFKAPHLIIKQSHKRARFLSDVLDFDAVFSHSFLGVHGSAGILKYICLIINSKIFSYYQLMTNRRWLVERDELEAGDILATPVPSPTKESIAEAASIFDRALHGQDELSLVNEFAYRQYALMPYEVSLVNDAIDHIYDYFVKNGRSITLKPPTEYMLNCYSDTLRQVLKNSLGKNIPFSCCIYLGDSPLLVATIDLAASATTDFMLSHNIEAMNALLEQLDNQLIETRSGSVYIKRNVRVYNKNRIHIVKPNQVRYWNHSAACRDADSIYADIITAWRDDNE